MERKYYETARTQGLGFWFRTNQRRKAKLNASHIESSDTLLERKYQEFLKLKEMKA